MCVWLLYVRGYPFVGGKDVRRTRRSHHYTASGTAHSLQRFQYSASPLAAGASPLVLLQEHHHLGMETSQWSTRVGSLVSDTVVVVVQLPVVVVLVVPPWGWSRLLALV